MRIPASGKRARGLFFSDHEFVITRM